jgi:hypothetical protein
MFRQNRAGHLRGAQLVLNSLPLIAALLAAIAFTTPLSAAIIVRDNWRDGTDDDPASPVYSENGVDADLDGNRESVWYQGGDGTLNPVTVGGPQRGAFSDPVGGGASASWTTYYTPEATPITLANTGDRMRLTWVFTPTGVNAGNTSQNFRLAVVNTPGANRLAANGSPGTAAYTGYGMFMNMGTTLGNANPFQLREHDNNGAMLSASGDWLALANGATSGNTGYASGTRYVYTMTLTRTAGGQLQVDSTMTGGSLDNDGTASVSFLDATPNGASFSFDTFSLRPSGATTTAGAFDTDLFRVDYLPYVPEPSTLLLLGLGGAALAMLRRRGC